MREEQERIITEMKRRRRRQLIATAPALAIVFLVLIMKREPNPQLLGISADRLVLLAIGGMAGVILFSLWNWRCPACKRYLGKTTNPALCSHCGVKLQE